MTCHDMAVCMPCQDLYIYTHQGESKSKRVGGKTGGRNGWREEGREEGRSRDIRQGLVLSAKRFACITILEGCRTLYLGWEIQGSYNN